MITAKQITGSWSLQTHQKILKSGSSEASAPVCIGRLVYSNDGYMSVLILLENEKGQAMGNIIYSGRYSAEDNVIYHHVDHAIQKRRVGLSKKRKASLDGQTLTLESEPVDGEFYRIVWVREGSSIFSNDA